MSTLKPSYVVVGGGIAGVTCIETLAYLNPDARIILISASPLIKKVMNFKQVTRVGETFDVEEQPLKTAEESHSNIRVIQASVESLCAHDQTLTTSSGEVIHYDKLCICTGGKPKLIAPNSPHVIGIRDTESVQSLQARLKTVKRVVIIGNGGIATELVYELEGCEVIWAIKDKSIANTFVDAGAGQFFLDHLNKDKEETAERLSKRLKYTQEVECTHVKSASSSVMGGALGPDWASNLHMRGVEKISHNVLVEYEVEVSAVMYPEEFNSSGMSQESHGNAAKTQEWPVYISLSNHKVFGCDLIISATGVTPFMEPFLKGNHLDLADDGGIKVSNTMETSEKNVYAAGDVCSANWEPSPHWLQMRLWSQARQMGCYAAKCMEANAKGEKITLDFCFELFTHVTNFFNFKVILLGKFNSQGLGDNQEILLRYTKGEEYVKAVLVDNRLVGGVLVGETDLEETFENLILNSMDLSPFKEHLLDPAIDIEDFFD